MTHTPKQPLLRPTLIRGVLYPSRSAAALALGVSASAIAHAIRAKRLETVGLRPHGSGGPNQPCRIRGVLYPSQKAAAVALGVASSTVSEALQRGTQDLIGLGSRR